MKEISPQHGENGRKSAILGVRGRKIFQPGCWIRRQGRRMFQPGCLWPRWCSGCRRTRPLCVPVGGGPPASRPRRELRSARRLVARPGPAGLAAASNRSGCLCVARPGPATAHGHRSLALRSLRRPSHRRCLGFLWLRVFLSVGDACGAADSSLGYSSVVRCTRSVGIAPVLIGCSAT